MAFRAEPGNATENMLALAAGDLDEAAFAQWIRGHLSES